MGEKTQPVKTMRKCILLFLLFVFVLAIASFVENRDREAVKSDKGQQELALREKSAPADNIN